MYEGGARRFGAQVKRRHTPVLLSLEFRGYTLRSSQRDRDGRLLDSRCAIVNRRVAGITW